MKVLYESLLSDLTKLCDQYDTVLSSTLDKRAPLRIAEQRMIITRIEAMKQEIITNSRFASSSQGA